MAILIVGYFHFYYENDKPKILALANIPQLLTSLLFEFYGSIIKSFLCGWLRLIFIEYLLGTWSYELPKMLSQLLLREQLI